MTDRYDGDPVRPLIGLTSFGVTGPPTGGRPVTLGR